MSTNGSQPGTRPVIYFVRASNGLVKVGTTENLKGRLSALRCASPVALELLASAPGGVEREAHLHQVLVYSRSHGEWFRATPQLMRFVDLARRDAAAWNALPPNEPRPARVMPRSWERATSRLDLAFYRVALKRWLAVRRIMPRAA